MKAAPERGRVCGHTSATRMMPGWPKSGTEGNRRREEDKQGQRPNRTDKKEREKQEVMGGGHQTPEMDSTEKTKPKA